MRLGPWTQIELAMESGQVLTDCSNMQEIHLVIAVTSTFWAPTTRPDQTNQQSMWHWAYGTNIAVREQERAERKEIA